MSSTHHPPPATRWTDSPWFWLFVFGGMGLVALVTVSPKYARRQERLQRMQETRQRVAASGRQTEAQASEARKTGSPLAARTSPTKPALRPLALFLALLLFIAALVMLGRRLNQRLTGGPADGEAPG